jgi:hypothetical protein
MKIAFYKSTKSGFAGIYNRIVRWWDNGKYSHCEIIFSDGLSASSSFADGGVRFKQIEYDPMKWNFIELDLNETKTRIWFENHQGCKYDIIGNVRFIIDFLPDAQDKWFCSESIAESLGIIESWRFSPNTLYSVLKSWSK